MLGIQFSIVLTFCRKRHRKFLHKIVLLLVSHRCPTVVTQVQSKSSPLWDLWWTKWHWNRYIKYLSFPISVLFYQFFFIYCLVHCGHRNEWHCIVARCKKFLCFVKYLQISLKQWS